jgi:hypothetical protein
VHRVCECDGGELAALIDIDDFRRAVARKGLFDDLPGKASNVTAS